MSRTENVVFVSKPSSGILYLARLYNLYSLRFQNIGTTRFNDSIDDVFSVALKAGSEKRPGSCR